ncbi:MAG: hypothetical protein AB8E82_16540 [Aureispira sp.]
MNKDLLELYKKTIIVQQTDEVKIIQAEIENLLVQDMQEHVLKLASIGNVIGYDKIKAHLGNALSMIELYDQHNKKSKEA